MKDKPKKTYIYYIEKVVLLVVLILMRPWQVKEERKENESSFHTWHNAEKYIRETITITMNF